MIYLDYSATTKVDESVLNDFLMNIDNNYSIIKEQERLQKLLNTNLDVIFTSGSTESNNRIIKGIALKYFNKGYHIITTTLEHSSILEQMKYLERNGFIIDYVKLNDGVVDLEDLERLITDKTILVSITAVNSEVGIREPINEIGKLLRKYNILFHSDMTQLIGKDKVNLDYVDLVSFTAHKFYGLKGIGVLLKRRDIELEPLIYGDITYNTLLIKSLNDALELSLKDIDEKYNYVLKLNNKLKEELLKIPNISINSNKYSIPHILNISVKGYKPETFLHTLENYNIFISTKSACSISNDYSKAVYSVTNNMENAKTSVRISLSYKTSISEVEELIKVLKGIFSGDIYDR